MLIINIFHKKKECVETHSLNRQIKFAEQDILLYDRN